MNTENRIKFAFSPVSEINDTITEVLRQGAKDMLAKAIIAHRFILKNIRNYSPRNQKHGERSDFG